MNVGELEASELVRRLAARLSSERVIGEAGELEVLARDMGDPPRVLRERLGCRAPRLAIRPTTTAELAAAVAELGRSRVPFTVRGLGSTGLGGAVPLGDGAVIDLSALSGVERVEEEHGLVTVRAGTTFFFLQQALERTGLRLGSRPSNAFGTVGGWAAAGGLGLGSLGAGPFSEQVEELEVVLPSGSREQVRQGEPGFDDFFDSEGQLGVISRLTVRLERTDGSQVVGGVLPALEAAGGWAARLAEQTPTPRTVMLAGRHGQGELVLAELPSGCTLPPLDDLGGSELPPEETGQLWSRRFFPLDLHLGPVLLASEVILALPAVAPFVRSAERLARRFGVPLDVHGHLVRAGTELRVLVLLVFPNDPRQEWHQLMLATLAAALTVMGIRAGGQPYGVGIWNTPFARERFGRERFARLERRKHSTDPGQLLGRGKLFRLDGRSLPLELALRPGSYPQLVRAAALAAPWLMRRHDPSSRPATDADRCISCGACVPVCPAVAASGAESVSGRAKVELLKRLLAGQSVPARELAGSLRCFKCGQCAEVCSRGLDLLACWEELEQAVRSRVAEDELRQAILPFVEAADQEPERLLAVALP